MMDGYKCYRGARPDKAPYVRNENKITVDGSV